MGFFRGEEGSVLFDKAGSSAAAVAGTTAWSLDVTKDVYETTDHGDTDRHFTAGLVSATGTVDLQYKQEAASEKSAELINDIFVAAPNEAAGQIAKFTLYLDTTGTKGFTFDGIITGATFGTRVGELTTVSCSFQVNGSITATLE
jgi:hypothetical protein